MSVFKKSRRWLCVNLAFLAGMAALGMVVQPTLGGQTRIGVCLREGCTGNSCTNCGGTDGLRCNKGGGAVGTCQLELPPLGCSCK